MTMIGFPVIADFVWIGSSAGVIIVVILVVLLLRR